MSRLQPLLFLLCLAASACEHETLDPVPASTAEPAADSTPNRPPVTELVEADSGGSSGTLIVRFTDPDGAKDLQWGQVLIHDRLEGTAACYLHWEHAGGTLYIRNDAADQLLGPTKPGQPGTLENSQCRIDAARVVATIEGDGVRLEVPVQPSPSFAGPKKVFLRAADRAGHTTEWLEMGAWGR